MPPRMPLSPEQALARVERKRESDRLAAQRYRARIRLAHQTGETVSTTHQTDGASQRSRQHDGPPGPPVLSEASLREIEEILHPLSVRGYVHHPPFWQLVRQQYPALSLAFEAWKLADWLEQPKNARRRCTKGFLDNWLKKAEQDRREREAGQPGGAPAPRPKVNGPVDPPIAYQKNPGPDPAPWLTTPLERFSPEEEARMREQQARVPYQERLAKLAAAGRNGVHR